MKRFWMGFLFVCCFVYGQDEIPVASQNRTINVKPVFQSWQLDSIGTVTEVSTPVEIYYAFNRRWSMDLTAGQAFASGKKLTSVSGLNDVQVLLNYYLESSNLVLNFGMAVPSGKKELSNNEFDTTILLSQNMLRFETPVFGQGFNWAPGLTWALPLSETVVFGFGASYQLKGGYKPVAKMTDSYKPGNELLVTTGVDARTGEAESFSFDLIWTRYDADKVGRAEIFRAGSKIMAAAQYQKYVGRDLLRLFVRYRSRAKNRIIFSGMSAEASKIQPDEFEWMGLYRRVFSSRVSWDFSAEIRLLQKTEAYDRVTILELGTGPDWRVSPSLKIPMKLGIGLGRFGDRKTLTGTDIGIGLEYQF